ncbi:DUF4826 family protein [Colwelliaceae bacterium BS250]
MSEENQLTEEQSKQWVREQYLKATKYLADKGIVTKSVITTESRYIVPVVAVWKLVTMTGESVWVIGGDVPSDHIAVSAAGDAREALRNFSMKWQLQADNLLALPGQDKTQTDFAHLLISRAEGLYHLFEDEKLWNMA